MTNKNSAQGQERGVALLITMFALMLLSVIALGMMVSTNTETSITSNFKDKQAATFAALAGLQEARDRIQPVTNSITAPTDVPSLSAQNIIYVINPKSGETITPWDIASKWADTELCQEHVPTGIVALGTAGVPCSTAISSATTWRRVVDNSSSGSAPWNLTTPLDVKWTRISLKTNNTTPIAVNGNTASSAVVCWDGTHQIALPAGYGQDCAPNGGVATITLTNPGSGYLSSPSVAIGAPPSGGVQATATAFVGTTTNGIVTLGTVTNGGSGYTSAPTVTLSGDGTGATATATIVALSGAPLASVSMTSAGTGCYTDPTQAPVIISGGGGSGAAAVSVLAGSTSCIQGWAVSGNLNGGTCKTTLKNTTATIGVTGGGGSGFSGSVSFDNAGKVTGTPTILAPGTGYTSAPTLNVLTGQGDCGLTYTINLGKRVASISLSSVGSSYTSVPSVAIGSGGTAGSGTATLGSPPANAGQVTAINIITGGTGYTTPPTVSFSSGGGTGAVATVTLGTTTGLTCCTITNPGQGYIADPLVTLSGGSGSGATAVATVGRGLNYGKVYALTSLAATANGSRTMMQMEVSTPPAGWSSMGALTIDGPDPNLGALPNSNNFVIHGADNNSCGGTPEVLHPAIAAYNDPSAPPTDVSSVQTIIDALPRPDHYTGAGGTPSVVDVYGNLGDTLGTPIGLNSLVTAIHSHATNSYTNDPGSINLGSSSVPAIDYVDGDLTLNGNHDGYGILVVTGTLHFGGNFNWHGVVLAIGDGVMDFNGGGNGQIIGTMLVAKIWNNHTSDRALYSSNGSPTLSWNGGGGNGILYDHCWATDMMNMIPYTPPPSTQQLRILSLRQLPY